MNIKTRNTCRICGNPNLKPVVDLGNQYFQGAFLKDGFPEKYTKAFRSIKIKPTGIKTIYQFDNLPAGNYAVAILADINDNGKMDMNLLGMPKEAFGFFEYRYFAFISSLFLFTFFCFRFRNTPFFVT